MARIVHERVELQGRRIGPRPCGICHVLALEDLDPEGVPTRFANVDRIRRFSRQHFVPIIEHDGRAEDDSRAIACRLEDRCPDRPSLYGGGIGRRTARLVNNWLDAVLGRSPRRQIYADFIWCIDPTDRAEAFRECREATAPLQRMQSTQRFPAGMHQLTSITWCSQCSGRRSSTVRAMCRPTHPIGTQFAPGVTAWWPCTRGSAIGFRGVKTQRMTPCLKSPRPRRCGRSDEIR